MIPGTSQTCFTKYADGDLPATIAITAVERKSFPLTRYEVKPKRSKNPPRAVNTTALPSVYPIFRCKCSHLGLCLYRYHGDDKYSKSLLPATLPVNS
jgi:hypothetical protein